MRDVINECPLTLVVATYLKQIHSVDLSVDVADGIVDWMAVRVLHFSGRVAGKRLVIRTAVFFGTFLWSSSQIFFEITKLTVSHLELTLVKKVFKLSRDALIN